MEDKSPNIIDKVGYVIAKVIFPLIINFIISNTKVEKVVKLLIKPVVIKCFTVSEIFMLSTVSSTKKQIVKLPLIFIRKVEIGKGPEFS